MTRTQVSIERETLRQAKHRAEQLGVSLAEYVRSLIARDLGRGQSAADPSAIFDLGDSGGSDIARHKDRMVGDAMAKEHRLR